MAPLACVDGDDTDDTPADTDDTDTDTDDTDDDEWEVPTLKGECALKDKVGSFWAQHEQDYSVVSGEVRDGTVPSTILELMVEDGDCRLMRSNNPFCDPTCQPDEACDFDGSCIPYPVTIDVGTVKVDGLNKDVAMSPPGNGLPSVYYDTQMPHPGFEPGADVRLVAAGNEIDGFTLYGEGVAPIVIPDEPWLVSEGKDMLVTWTPDKAVKQARIFLRFNIDQHGSTPVSVWCDIADTGSYSVPSSVMDALIAYGVTGFPNGNIYRRSVDSVETSAGCVEFEVSSRITGTLNVEGHIPCDGPEDCPKGMICDLTIGTCVFP
ncbi:MAG: hypothetical protein HN348_12330 [Proteobacteria bacterium]|nr:hypothetical protein [Pseudomonadota bacterium]